MWITTVLSVVTGLSGPIRDIVSKISDLKIAQVQASDRSREDANRSTD